MTEGITVRVVIPMMSDRVAQRHPGRGGGSRERRPRRSCSPPRCRRLAGRRAGPELDRDPRHRPTRHSVDVSRPRLIRDATFLEADRREIALRRGPHNRLGFAYQVAFVRVLGRFPQQAPLEIDGEILRFAALQLGADAETIHAYERRQQTVSEHQQRIGEYLRLRTFDTAVGERLARFLEDEALRLDRTASLLARARGWLRDEHVLAPADSVLRRAVGAARHKARALLTQRMAERLSAPMRDRLDESPSATTSRIRRCTASRPARRARRSVA